ncbi:MAG: RNA polymerase sigma factor [Rhodocyclaceae bacterium]|nr:RNA polymerase sigma factor [Rhodocyclaceae bacterium]
MIRNASHRFFRLLRAMPRQSPILDLYRRHASELHGFISARLRCKDTAADLTQEVFLRLSGRDGVAIRDPLAFAYRIARNLIVSHHREQCRRHEESNMPEFDDIPSAEPGPEEIAAVRQSLSKVEAALERLPPQSRRAFVLNRFEGLSQVEVAQRMGISRQMAERHIAQAILRLRELLDEAAGR